MCTHVSLSSGLIPIVSTYVLVLTAIRQLLILYSYFTPKLYSHLDPPSLQLHRQASLCTSFVLPAELWREVAGWLPRPDWRTLLRVPHPLRKFCFELFFQEIYLHLDVYQPEQIQDLQLKNLEAWQLQRTTEILRRVTADFWFASRVRTLRISMRCGAIPNGMEPLEVIQFERSKPSAFVQIILDLLTLLFNSKVCYGLASHLCENWRRLKYMDRISFLTH